MGIHEYFKAIPRSLGNEIAEDPYLLVDWATSRPKVRSDFPHSLPHQHQVQRLSYMLAPIYGLPEEEGRYMGLTFAAILHDKGRETTGITDEEHALYGFLRAAIVLPEEYKTRELAHAILFHSADVVPFDSPPETRIIKAADVIAGSGWEGIIRFAYYSGFRHPAFTKKSGEEIIREGLLLDTHTSPLDDNHEQQVQQFVEKNITPFLIANDKVGEMISKIRSWVDHYLFQTELGRHYSKGNKLTPDLLAYYLGIKRIQAMQYYLAKLYIIDIKGKV